MSKTCEDCGNATCVCEGIGKMLTEAKCGTCGRDMNDAYNRLLCREHFTASIAAMTSELAEARDRLATIVDETVGIHPVLTTDELLTLLEKWAHETRIDRDESRRMLGEVTAKFEALEHEHRGALSDLKWCIPLAEDMASEDDGDFEEWLEIKERWLEGGPHGAGEAK